ncbi:MAG: MBL fold metallo-hydrolase [Deltaproteobacteria bacterium]|nr:MBL fold metallo-hydrolase [Deltaproteobacteria bacterium]
MLVAQSVYYYPFTSAFQNNCNSVLLDGPEKILIDPGHKFNWPKLSQMIAKDGIDPSSIKLVLYTHCHPDHMEAGEILETDYGAVQAMSPEEKVFYDGPGLSFFSWMGLDIPKGHIGRTVAEGRLELSDKVLDIYLTPGHSPGSICLHWPEVGVLVTGDLVFARGWGRTDFEGGDSKAIVESITRMSKLADVSTLLCGHGPAVMGETRVADNFRHVLAML